MKISENNTSPTATADEPSVYTHFYKHEFNVLMNQIADLIDKANSLLDLGFAKEELELFLRNRYEQTSNPDLEEYLKNKHIKESGIAEKYAEFSEKKILEMVTFPDFSTQKRKITFFVSAVSTRSIPTMSYLAYTFCNDFWDSETKRFLLPESKYKQLKKLFTVEATEQEASDYITLLKFQEILHELYQMLLRRNNHIKPYQNRHSVVLENAIKTYFAEPHDYSEKGIKSLIILPFDEEQKRIVETYCKR